MARLITPNEGSIQDASQSYNRDLPSGSAEIAYAPGAGLLDWRLAYHLSGTLYESSQYQSYSNVLNEIETRGRWRFLPRTALVYDGRFGFLTYPSPPTVMVGTGKNGGHPVRTLIGINGLVTNSFSLLVMGGWGASFYTPAPQNDFDSVIGQVELRWLLSPASAPGTVSASGAMSSVALGFTRDFYDCILGTYYERDRGYLSFSHLFAGKFLLVAEGGVGPMVFPSFNSTVVAQTVQGFTDVRIDGSLFGEYRFADSFGVNATFRYDQEIGNGKIPQAGNQPDTSLAFQQIQAFLGVRWLM